MKTSSFARGFLVLVGLAGSAAAQFKYWDPESAEPPATLSATGLYVNLSQNKTMISAAVPFEVNSPLWSDGSAKKRWILLKTGTKVAFNAKSDYLDYPDSAVFVKQFAIDTIPGDTLSRRLWETRVMILKKQDVATGGKKIDKWYGYSYRWRKDGKDADLLADTGYKDTVGWYPGGKGTKRVLKKWAYPRRDQCVSCHGNAQRDSVHARTVLGFFAAQLNRPSVANPSVNQIEELFNKNVFSGTRPANYNDTDIVPRWYGVESTDPKATLEKKSRAYIAANCSGCHGTRGVYTGVVFVPTLNYDYHEGKPEMVFEYLNLTWNFGLDEVEPVSFDEDSLRYMGVYLVTPGYPQKSAVLYRQTVRNTKAANDTDATVRDAAFDSDLLQMPPLATYEENTAATTVIRNWILSLPKTGKPAVSARHSVRPAPLAPVIRGGNLVLPPGLAHEGRVSIVGIDGQSRTLARVGSGIYALPAGLPKGVYVIRVGNQRFKRSLF